VCLSVGDVEAAAAGSAQNPPAENTYELEVWTGAGRSCSVRAGRPRLLGRRLWGRRRAEDVVQHGAEPNCANFAKQDLILRAGAVALTPCRT
jgi:hypothetical protein